MTPTTLRRNHNNDDDQQQFQQEEEEEQVPFIQQQGSADALCMNENHCISGIDMDSEQCQVNKGLPTEMVCIGYQRSTWKSILALLSIICSGGLMLLVFYWKPVWKLKCTHTKCKMRKASYVYLRTIDEYTQESISPLQYMPTTLAYLMENSYSSALDADEENGKYGTFGDEDTSSGEGGGDTAYFIHQSLKYIWYPEHQCFMELRSLDGGATLKALHKNAVQGLDEESSLKRRSLYGLNLVTVTVPSYLNLLFAEILNPFYVFQLFACIFWFVDEYVTYATSIMIISFVSAVSSLIQVRRERQKLHDMVEYHNETKVTLQRRSNNDEVEHVEVWAKDLVPGDVIIIPPGGVVLACDAVLTSGTCIVNESMLTGESVPVTKTPLPSGREEMKQMYTIDEHKRHTLFSGTEVIQTRFYSGESVKAVVVRTGYLTSKGALVHSILYPKPVNLKLMKDAYMFVMVLFGIAMCGFVYTVIYLESQDEDPFEIVLSSFDLITISVPPALPLALSIGLIYAQQRLKNYHIHCISPQRINISGQIDVVAFDKTGTLTEDGLDLQEILPVRPSHLVGDGGQQQEFSHQPVSPQELTKEFKSDHKVLQLMASCHTLTVINGKLNGDPLELKLFESTDWKLVEPTGEEESQYDRLESTYVTPPLSKFDSTFVDSMDTVTTSSFCSNDSGVSTTTNNPGSGNNSISSDALSIVRQFPFSSSLQRSSVLVKLYRSRPREMLAFMKGAPEKVASLCDPQTVPPDFAKVLSQYSSQGLRMIGMAYKEVNLSWMKAQKVERTSVESNLKFLGLIALQNKLKPQTKDALQVLHTAGLRTLMVTGDNILTSISVARECGIVPSDDTLLLANTQVPEDPGSKPTLTWTVVEADNSTTSDTICTTLPKKNGYSNGNKGDFKMNIEETTNWHLAISGKDFAVVKNHFPGWLPILAVKGAVFSRMGPDQKTDLMEELQNVDYHVCMCGDGANDCGALKLAHVGLSLSEHEASVAAPFTSKTENGIECVCHLIREGRAALVTSFGLFKFMALYSLIQFTSITILYYYVSNLSDLGYLYIDLIVIDLVVLTMSRNHAYKKLSPTKPPSSLVAVEMMVSLVGHILLQFIFQFTVLFVLHDQCWFTSLTPAEAANTTFNTTACPEFNNIKDQSEVEDEHNVLTYETATLLYLSVFIYLSESVAFSRGRPFRTALYKNRLYLLSLVVLVAATVLCMFVAPVQVLDFLMVRHIPDNRFLVLILIFALTHLILSVAFESLIINTPSLWDALRDVWSKKFNKAGKGYEQLLEALSTSSDVTCNHDNIHIGSHQSSVLAVPHPLRVVNQKLEAQNCQGENNPTQVV